MRWYLDTSIALHAVFPWGDDRAYRWLDGVVASGATVLSSTLLELEVVRALRRERLALSLATPLLKRTNLVSLEDGVLRVAAAIEPHAKALDAIHLATCSMLGFGITLVTHDTGMLAAAAALGLDRFDPLASR